MLKKFVFVIYLVGIIGNSFALLKCRDVMTVDKLFLSNSEYLDEAKCVGLFKVDFSVVADTGLARCSAIALSTSSHSSNTLAYDLTRRSNPSNVGKQTLTHRPAVSVGWGADMNHVYRYDHNSHYDMWSMVESILGMSAANGDEYLIIPSDFCSGYSSLANCYNELGDALLRWFSTFNIGGKCKIRLVFTHSSSGDFTKLKNGLMHVFGTARINTTTTTHRPPPPIPPRPSSFLIQDYGYSARHSDRHTCLTVPDLRSENSRFGLFTSALPTFFSRVSLWQNKNQKGPRDCYIYVMDRSHPFYSFLASDGGLRCQNTDQLHVVNVNYSGINGWASSIAQLYCYDYRYVSSPGLNIAELPQLLLSLYESVFDQAYSSGLNRLVMVPLGVSYVLNLRNLPRGAKNSLLGVLVKTFFLALEMALTRYPGFLVTISEFSDEAINVLLSGVDHYIDGTSTTTRRPGVSHTTYDADSNTTTQSPKMRFTTYNVYTTRKPTKVYTIYPNPYASTHKFGSNTTTMQPASRYTTYNAVMVTDNVPQPNSDGPKTHIGPPVLLRYAGRAVLSVRTMQSVKDEFLAMSSNRRPRIIDSSASSFYLTSETIPPGIRDCHAIMMDVKDSDTKILMEEMYVYKPGNFNDGVVVKANRNNGHSHDHYLRILERLYLVSVKGLTKAELVKVYEAVIKNAMLNYESCIILPILTSSKIAMSLLFDEDLVKSVLLQVLALLKAHSSDMKIVLWETSDTTLRKIRKVAHSLLS